MRKHITYDDLIEKLNYITNEKELDKIHEAFLFASNKHKGKKRLNGDYYIEHPLNVAIILTDYNVDYITIIGALLHETVNHGGATVEEIKEAFGEEVARVVDSISKINRLSLPDDKESSAIHLRKVLVGISENVSVLFIKLADRLHNMRTIYALDPKDQKAKITETQNVLIPIAHRLGINAIKSELEDLCLKYSKPDIYQEIEDKLNETSKELNKELDLMIQSVSDILTAHDLKFSIKGRVKSIHSIYDKMASGHTWKQIYDILALRVILENESDCYLAVGLIHAKYRPLANRFKDYIAMPKANMYQSLHTSVYGIDGYIFEVQLRTLEMDEIAEKGIASHWSYKEHGSNKKGIAMEQKLELFRNLIEESNENNSDIEFSRQVNQEVLSDMIYCFTPKGDAVELPAGATPIDFAYRIHSRVGETTVSAIVNGKIIPLSASLHDGDMVTIKTSTNAKPSKEWENFVVTTQAKNKIRAYFSKQDKDNYILKGQNMLEKEARKRKIPFNEIINQDSIEKLKKDLKIDSIDDLYLSIGSLRYTPIYIINIIKEDKKDVLDILISKVNNSNSLEEDYKSDIIVAGTDNIKVTLAKCCRPIKGDLIVGYITKGQGITIHRQDCINALNNKERLIDVTWNNESNKEYYTKINITVDKSKNHLAEIINQLALKDIKTESIQTKENDLNIIYEIMIKVKNKDKYNDFIKALYKFNYIINIERVSN